MELVRIISTAIILTKFDEIPYLKLATPEYSNELIQKYNFGFRDWHYEIVEAPFSGLQPFAKGMKCTRWLQRHSYRSKRSRTLYH